MSYDGDRLGLFCPTHPVAVLPDSQVRLRIDPAYDITAVPNSWERRQQGITGQSSVLPVCSPRIPRASPLQCSPGRKRVKDMTENSLDPNVSNSDPKDFMIAQYQALSDSFWRNEELGERRVNFLIALVTAVIAALVALADVEGLKTERFLLPTILAVTALLGLGIVTWHRMLRRNLVTDEYKRAMGIVRSWFENDDGKLKDYRPFPDLLRYWLEYEEVKAELPETGGPTDMTPELIEKFDPHNKRLGARPKIQLIEADRRWLVYSGWRFWRKSRYLIKRANGKLYVYKPRKPSGGGLAEMVCVMNSVFFGALLFLLPLFLAVVTTSTKDGNSIDDALLIYALIIWGLGTIGAIIVQWQWMINFYDRYDIWMPKGDSPQDGNSIPSLMGK